MTSTPAAVLCFALCAISTVVTLAGQQKSDVRWPSARDVPIAERDDVLRLTARAGITTPVRAEIRQYMPVGGRFLVVSSKRTLDGPHITWYELEMCREDWCWRRRPGLKEGAWLVNGSVTFRDAWRIADGNWDVDVELGPDVTYADAQVIVRAVHRRTVVDRRAGGLPGDDIATALKEFKLNDLSWITRHDDAYELRTGTNNGGQLLMVKMRNGQVEFHGLSTWIV